MTDFDALQPVELADARPEPKGYRGPMGEANQPQFEIVGICHRCENAYADGFTCRAFPDGIPNMILIGDFVHTKPYPGDGGVLFINKGGLK